MTRRKVELAVKDAASLCAWCWTSGVLNFAILLGAWLGASIWLAQFFPRIWPLAVAVLCLSFAGYRWAWRMVSEGLFALGQPREAPRRHG